jgi:hypothetical protein
LSAVVDIAVLSLDGLGRKPSLLILRQLAYLAGDWPVQPSSTTDFRPDDGAAAVPACAAWGKSICELLF